MSYGSKKPVRMVPAYKVCPYCGQTFRVMVRAGKRDNEMHVCTDCTIFLLQNQVRDLQKQMNRLSRYVDNDLYHHRKAGCSAYRADLDTESR